MSNAFPLEKKEEEKYNANMAMKFIYGSTNRPDGVSHSNPECVPGWYLQFTNKKVGEVISPAQPALLLAILFAAVPLALEILSKLK